MNEKTRVRGLAKRQARDPADPADPAADPVLGCSKCRWAKRGCAKCKAKAKAKAKAAPAVAVAEAEPLLPGSLS